MAKTLVIVESPTKARKISEYLGKEVVVEASMGHIRDLPRSAKEIPAKYKDEPWAKLGVNVDEGFEPIYVLSSNRRDNIKKLRDLAKSADEIFLATDEDREGEAIAWHLVEVLNPKVPVKRMVFHEITANAIREAFEHPREVNDRLVDAQEARRILDRLYGYEVSPVLWKKVATGLSAGRVQSVAVRIVVERERERMAFTSASYWDLEGRFAKVDGGAMFDASLVAIDGTRIAQGRDFDATGRVSGDVLSLDAKGAGALAAALEGAEFAIRSVETKPYTRKPYPPFRTSTLQVEAGRKLRFSSSRTMSVAQRLYENGYITYMRTDSVTLSGEAITEARNQVGRLYGDAYVPPSPRFYGNQAKSAQEAHEAIRPAGDSWPTPQQVAGEVGPDEAKLYELIWKRTLASQMPDAKGETVSVRLGATAADGRDAEFAASGRTITFAGFLKVYVESLDDPNAQTDDQESILPPLEQGEAVDVVDLEPVGHDTQPPRRYTEASLVQKLEELGVGRPSTYASILTTIQDRGYVWKKGGALIPSFTAFAVVTLLEQHFPNLVDYAFTARMEDDLDRIAAGDEERVPWLTRFYLGAEGLRQTVEEKLGDIDARAVNSIPIGTDDAGRQIVARVGRYGPYLERDDERASVPDDIPPDELSVERATELIDEGARGDKILGTDPESGLAVYARTGRFGPYVQLGEQEEGSKEKPRRASLFKGMELDALGLDDALRLLSLPRTVGTDPDGVEVVALNGRYGPYIQRGDDRRSLETEEQLFTLTVEEALTLLAEPPRRRGQTTPSALREVGDDPVSGKKVTVRSGRYGPYVTDGDVNASLRKGDDPASIGIERAAELLALRREKLAE
ncbi:MAG TPA: type I DNA topoisomerase [Acidimicrobiia bacterium]|nr:type I DNA topoisomerase [Acidimicrobiia bacterium]